MFILADIFKIKINSGLKIEDMGVDRRYYVCVLITNSITRIIGC